MYNKIGQFAKDLEEGINFQRLREDRLRKTREAMKRHGLGAIVAGKEDNSRYITGFRGLTAEGSLYRYVVLPVDGDPVLFELGGDIGRAEETAPWLDGNITNSIPVLGTPHFGGPAEMETRKRLLGVWAKGIKDVLVKNGVANEKVGFDSFDVSAIEPLEEANINFVDAKSTMYDARAVKTKDELQLLSIASSIAEAGFYRMKEVLRPGIRDCEVWAEAIKTMLSLGAETVTGICTSGGRTYPYYRLEGTDKIVRPGDLLISDIVTNYMGYYTCVVRTFLVGDKPSSEQKKLYQDTYEAMYRTMNTCKAGVMTDTVAAALPEGNWKNFSLNISHGLGLHYHEAPFTAEIYSKSCPVELKSDMYLAVETYEGNPEINQGVRLEENFVITEDGYEVFSRFPFEDKLL